MNSNGKTVRKKQKQSGTNQTPAPKRSGVQRHVAGRVSVIHRAIHSGSYPNANTLAQQIEVSVATIYDDLDYMRYTLGLPIEFDSVKHGFYYSEPVDYCPTLLVTEGDLFSLILAEKVLQECSNPSQRRTVLKTFKKIAETFRDVISFDLDNLDECLSFRTSSQPVFDPNLIHRLAKAAAQRQQLKIVYETPDKPPGERIVNPYHICRIDRDWFLFAYDFKRDCVICFAPSRMKNVEETGETFVRPADFQVKKHLDGALAVIGGSKKQDIIIRFNRKVAHLIRERRFNGQTDLKELLDGGVELHLKLGSLVEVHRRILEYEGDAIPIAPPELREMYVCTAKKMLGNMGVV